MNKVIKVNFNIEHFKDTKLFTGRKNGKAAKTYFKIDNGDRFVINAADDQIITSSYFLGLLGDELTKLLNDSKDINDLISKVDVSTLNKVSQDECIRAIRRGLVRNE